MLLVGNPDGETEYMFHFLSDLALCKEKFGRFSEDPSKFTDEFEKLTMSFDLTWQDLQILSTGL